MVRIMKKIAHNTFKIIKKQVKKNENSVRWGIIGLGYMAECFSSAIDGNKDGIVVAAASRSIEKAKAFASRRGQCKAYGSYVEMLSDNKANIDVIYVATPTKYHYEHIKMCLMSGYNVLCEKPIVTTAEQLVELNQLAQDKKCFLMEGMWMKCLPTYQKALGWLDDGKIGDLELIKVDFYKREVVDHTKAIYNKDEAGGVLRDYGIYAVSFPTGFISGMPDVIEGHSRKSLYGIDTDWSIIMKYGNVKTFINISSNFQSTSKAAIIGNQGMIEWNSQFNRTNTITLYDKIGLQVEIFSVNYDYDGFEYEVNEVQKSIKANYLESNIVSLEESLITLKIIDQLMKGYN